MTLSPLSPLKSPYTKTGKAIPLIAVTSEQFKKIDTDDLKTLKVKGFAGKKGEVSLITKANGSIAKIYTGIGDDIDIYTLSHVAGKLSGLVSESEVKKLTLSLSISGFKKEEKERLYLSWALSQYKFDIYKSGSAPMTPKLLLPKDIDEKHLMASYEALSLLRNMVNIPANDMTPATIESTVKKVATKFKATVKTVKGQALEKGFPLVHMVGKAASIPPRLVELNWGKKTHPKLTLVGKGVSFDSGGLNMKPGQYMALMKKDMAGSAHALAIAYIVMALKLPVQLKLLIPTVENAIAGNAFRPGDITKSRKGITVENTNTDAEGRLILADALTYASEDKPELIMDFATLTGSARAALGQVIPPFFSTDDKEAEKIQKLSFEVQDPVWRMPLYQPYKKIIESDIADLVNSASPPGDLIYSALFLQQFVEEKINWMHFDIFAWEPSGKPGRPKGGAETGLWTVVSYLQQRFG